MGGDAELARSLGELVEIRLHGRGGQGTVVASLMLARAAMLEGRGVQAFPEFGVERRGAPVTAYLRLSDHPIHLRCKVYEPDHVLVLDPHLLPQVDLPLDGEGWLVVNTAADPAARAVPGGWRSAALDATRVARAHGIGSGALPVVNSPMAGAFARVTGLVGLEALEAAIREMAPVSAEANVRAARQAWDEVRAAPAREPRAVPDAAGASVRAGSRPRPGAAARGGRRRQGVTRLPDGRIRFESPEDVPPVAMSLASTAWNRTGDWRSREPFFRDVTPPCAFACPAAQDVVDQLRLLSQGRIREAGEVILASNPFPATTGRVCPHPCTAACNRGRMEGAVDVPGVERALGDALLAESFELPRRAAAGARVAVVGAGPAGLTAAHFLALGGHEVVLYDREERPGGLLRIGIPPYRLPRQVLDGEVARALRPGVRFEGGRALGRNLDLARLERESDAVLVAMGRHAPRRLGVPGEGAAGVVDGLALLAALHRGEAAPPGRRAVVVGGGNTALDCARSLRRRGFEVTVAYRRARADMPAFADEVEEALEEGVELEEWHVPVEVCTAAGTTLAMRFVRAQPGAPDASGRARPVAVPGSDRALDADLVVVAAGEGLDPAGLPASWVDRGALAPVAGADGRVLALGDCAGGGGTVAHAIAAGRRAAAAVTGWLGGASPSVDLLAERGAAPEVAGFDRMRPAWYRPVAPAPRLPEDAALRRQDDREVRRGFSRAEAMDEAARCLGCGTCAGCDVCFHLCPDRAVVRGSPGGYAVDTSRCKGCGICVEECPRAAVELRELGGA